MIINKDDFAEKLAQCSPDILAEILSYNGLLKNPQVPATEMGKQISSFVWGNCHSPMKQMTGERDLSSIMSIYGKRLKFSYQSQDPWVQLQELTNHLIPYEQSLEYDDLPEEVRKRLESASWPKFAVNGQYIRTT